MGTSVRITQKTHRPPREYVVIVGGPSNMFNGFFHTEKSGTAEEDDVPEEAPKTTDPAQIKKYIYGQTGIPKAKDAPDKTVTHDLFWANFLYAAVKLFESGRVQPRPGDIVTFVLYLPPYLLRQTTDWAASPYHPRHTATTWVNNDFPYDPSRVRDQQGTGAPAVSIPKTPKVAPIPSPREDDINFDIFMRATSETDTHGNEDFNGGYYKRPQTPDAYEVLIQDVPYRLTGKTVVRYGPALRNVLVKLLMLRKDTDVLDYLAKGTWTGNLWKRNQRLAETDTYAASSDYHRGAIPEEWKATPAVDRSKVKIQRLDYFGHSGYIQYGTPEVEENALFLQYGWSNEKGVLPGAEVTIASSDLEKVLSPSILTKDASAQLWGCRLGDLMAPRLKGFFPKKILATDQLVDFSIVLDSPTVLPKPSDGSDFKSY